MQNDVAINKNVAKPRDFEHMTHVQIHKSGFYGRGFPPAGMIFHDFTIGSTEEKLVISSGKRNYREILSVSRGFACVQKCRLMSDRQSLRLKLGSVRD